MRSSKRCFLLGTLALLLLPALPADTNAQEARRRWERMCQIRKDKFDLILPEVMRDMSDADRELYVQKMMLEREELRLQIAELSDKRRRHIIEQIEAKGIDDSWAFDSVVRQTIRKKAEEKGFYFKEP